MIDHERFVFHSYDIDGDVCFLDTMNGNHWMVAHAVTERVKQARQRRVDIREYLMGVWLRDPTTDNKSLYEYGVYYHQGLTEEECEHLVNLAKALFMSSSGVIVIDT